MALPLRPAERRLQWLLRCWVICFTAMAIVLAFLPTTLVSVVNAIGAEWFHWSGPPLANPTDRFFGALAVSLLVVLTLLCYGIQHDVRRRLSAVRLLLLSKLISSGVYAVSYVMDARYFAYVVGTIADGAIFAVTYYYYRSVRRLV